MKIEATFVRSAAGEVDFPAGGAPALAIVGRSNVGKSSLINALVRQRVARTSATPGKTRLANIYRVRRGASPPLVLVDLPGYGYARGGTDGFGPLVAAYFEAAQGHTGTLLLVDARHPGLDSDVAAWDWLRHGVAPTRIVATKIDKLARGQRIRALGELQSVFDNPVLPVSAVTGEGLDELWKLIDRLTYNPKPTRPSRSSRAATAPPPHPSG